MNSAVISLLQPYDSLSTCFINYLETGFEISNYDCGFAYLSFRVLLVFVSLSGSSAFR